MLSGADIQQLKDYVAGEDGGMQAQAGSTVRLHVSHSNLKAKFMEIRLDKHVGPPFPLPVPFEDIQFNCKICIEVYLSTAPNWTCGLSNVSTIFANAPRDSQELLL